MIRRHALRWLVSAVAVLPFQRLRLFAQPVLAEGSLSTLRDLAAVVLPSELGRAGTDEVAAGFARWVRNYREGAELAHDQALVPKVGRSGPSPAPRYVQQLAALETAARAQGTSFAKASAEVKKSIVIAALEESKVQELPERPVGASVVVDLMSYYFHSSEANDLCYRAQIGRTTCRGLSGSEERPAPSRAADVRRFESDICVVGSGITATLVAQKLLERRPDLSLTLVEAGRKLFDFENRTEYRHRWLEYGENPWAGDMIEDQHGPGVVSRTMAVGGQALHWSAQSTRFSREDLRLRSAYGLAVDWPLEWEELEKLYGEAERRIGVSGEQGPPDQDPRSEPYPMPAMPLTHNLATLKKWAERSGIRFWSVPVAKNTLEYDGRPVCRRCDTCAICPTGARYSPDFTLRRLVEKGKLVLHERTLVRRLLLHDTGDRIAAATAVNSRSEPVEYRARLFVLASGFAWSPHLLLLSACSRFPNGLANRSGLVGRYMTGHKFLTAPVELDGSFYPGMNIHHHLQSREFFRPPPEPPFVRFDLRLSEGAAAQPRVWKGSRVLLGDEVLADWRGRTSNRGTARVGAVYEVHPARESALTLDKTRKNRWGDPLPTVDNRFDEATRTREPAVHERLVGVFQRLARTQNATLGPARESGFLLHPAGGCRMGTDPAESVCDSFGQTHDHPNLFVVGAPTLPTGGCTNGTLTFSALALRSADRIAETLGAS